MEAGKRSINDIFNGNKILEIPFFQRAYVWDAPQWERFVSDMEFVSQNNKPYFLGSVILKQQLTNSGQSVGDKRTVIDGQQRLTTLNIFFKVLSLKLGNGWLNDIFRLPMRNKEIALVHNRNDLRAFNQVMNLTALDDLYDEDSVTRAYMYFKNNIDEKKINFQNVLTNLMFVGVDLNHDDDEQQIFDTINSLGVKLTTAELLKNYFFGRNDIQSYEDNWQGVFEKDAEVCAYWDTEIFAGRFQRSFLDLFFYSFLQIKIQDSSLDISSEDKSVFTKVDGLFESYKKFIANYNIKKEDLISEIKEYALIFANNFSLDVVNQELPEKPGIERINAIIFGLESSTLIPYVLYVLKNVSDVNKQNEIFDYLESYVMRRMVCHESTKNYNQLFSERFISHEITQVQGIREFISGQSEKVNFMPTNEEVAKGFEASKLTNKQAAGILYLIETRIRNRSLHSTSMLGISKYSLEHIMPKKWENHWHAVASEEEKNARNRKLLTLGNLTIITGSLNSSIRDSDWNTKRDGKSGKAGLRQYASGLETFSEYLSKSVWDESVIDARANQLASYANQIWTS
jgi:uncharacterized protein with ParB-like and HNH nuclease domain